MAVHGELGAGFLEAVYRGALPIEFERRKIRFRPEVLLPVKYRGVQLPVTYKADFVCESGVIVEVKAVDSLSSHDEAQLLNYLKASGIRRGLVINFGAASLEYKRRVWGYE